MSTKTVICPHCNKPMQAVGRWALLCDDVWKFHCDFHDYIYSYRCMSCDYSTRESASLDEAYEYAVERSVEHGI